MQSGALLSLSPSFNSYSASLAEIAARVVEECRADHTDLSCQEDAFCFNRNDFNTQNCGENFPDDEFEFSFVTRDVDSSTISADEIFYNGQIRPVFPVFGKEIFPGVGAEPTVPPPVRLPLGKLLVEERRRLQASNSYSSCSSSEADELDGVPPGTYCVWKPKMPAGEAGDQRRQKSNSTGSSSSLCKRWRFRELVGRSNSDGKGTFAFRMPSRSTSQVTAAAATSGGGAAAANDMKRRFPVGHFANVNRFE